MILGRVDRNSIKPRIKRTLAPEARQCPICLDKGLLRDVFDVGRVPDDAREQARDSALVFRNQQFIRVLVSALYASHQLPVDVALGHWPLGLPVRGAECPPLTVFRVISSERRPGFGIALRRHNA